MDVQDLDHQQSSHNNAYFLPQLKELNRKFDIILTSQQNTTQTVHQLSKVIEDMQERMDNIQQLLHSVLDSQQVIIMKCSQ